MRVEIRVVVSHGIANISLADINNFWIPSANKLFWLFADCLVVFFYKEKMRIKFVNLI